MGNVHPEVYPMCSMHTVVYPRCSMHTVVYPGWYSPGYIPRVVYSPGYIPRVVYIPGEVYPRWCIYQERYTLGGIARVPWWCIARYHGGYMPGIPWWVYIPGYTMVGIPPWVHRCTYHGVPRCCCRTRECSYAALTRAVA